MVLLRILRDIFGVVFGDSFAYLFVAPETLLPAPSAPEGKIVCRRKTEICSVKKIMAGGRVLGRSSREEVQWREGGFVCLYKEANGCEKLLPGCKIPNTS